MPANLPPQYLKAEDEYRRASTPAQRFECLRQLFLLLPKHKGTEKLQAELKKKISRARDDLEGAKPGAKKSGMSYRVPRDGAGQVVLVGPPNSGKSALLAAITNAKPEVAAYPFTTRAPQPGLATWLDVRFQIVDLPAVSPDFFESWIPGIVRSADASLFVVDLADDDLIDAAEACLQKLSEAHIQLVAKLPEDSGDESLMHVKTIMVANKIDADGADIRFEMLQDWFQGRFPIMSISATQQTGLDVLRRAAYDSLEVIRLYSKIPGKPTDRSHPFTVPVGSTVLDLAREVHRDLEHTLKYAKVWGTGVFEGQTVKRDHELHDADVVELHA